MESKKNPKLDLGKKRTMFLSIGLMLSLLFVTSAFHWSSEVQPIVDLPDYDPWEEPPMEVLATTIPSPPKPKVIQPIVKEVKDDVEIPDDVEVIIDPIDIDPNDLMVDIPEPVEAIVEASVDWTEFMPEPKGGIKAFQKFLSKNIRYPNQARRMGIEGRVFVQFIVDKQGNITEIKTLKGIGAGCDEEAERVMSIVPKWKPGKQGARRVAVRMIMPISFRLN